MTMYLWDVFAEWAVIAAVCVHVCVMLATVSRPNHFGRAHHSRRDAVQD